MNKNWEIYKEYLNSCIVRNESVKNTTYRTYTNSMKQFIEYLRRYENNCYLLNRKNSKNMVVILERYIRYCREVKRNNARTINNKITAISSFYIWAVKRDLVEVHPFRDKLDRLKVTDVEKRRESYYLNSKEIVEIQVKMKLSEKYDLQDQIIFNLIIDTGCRISALHSIKMSNLDLENGIINGIVEKEQKIVEFVIFENTLNLIKEWLKCRKGNIEYLFVTKYNGVFKQMSKSTIRDRVRKIGKLVGIDNLYPHTLRKTSINLLAEVGGIELASEFANHNGVDVTKKHYIKKTTAKDRKSKLLEIRKKAGF
ncbi:tyrosine-type recombinase/integrase [Leptotrichia sp. oral taxon 223]|uniref:tyrosine-type recombinase/integrase n=1 Tax=Leptotrichia sp. oral taxon 223 TaxID=712363 RepID=UPI0015B7B487|nr:tyrosine-type recombinase/integrase [Leptotrichia sp. oral taxon 223]NWO18157.1 tyrosine-type recombinase/integrase [Leptotrichia sp. oral taxon 223]